MTNGISINAGFDVGSANPIDTRQWLSTAEMKNADVNTMPDPYFAINKEDHFLYIFSKTNPISESTGYFTKYTNDGGMTVWKGSEAERDALPEETRADESIIFYTWDTASAEYKNVVSKTVGTVENMSEADYQALETKDARTIYTTPGHIRVGEESILSDFNWLAGKTVNFLGDSITRGSWYNTEGVWQGYMDNPYPSIIAQVCHCTSNNYGVSGSPIRHASDNSGCVDRAPSMEVADVNVLFAGVNDLTGGTLGTKDSTDISTVYGALKSIAETFLSKNPASINVFISTLMSNITSGAISYPEMREAMEYVAKLYGFLFIDASKEAPMMNPNNATINAQWLNNNDVHPNPQYHVLLGNWLARKFMSYDSSSSLGSSSDIPYCQMLPEIRTNDYASNYYLKVTWKNIANASEMKLSFIESFGGEFAIVGNPYYDKNYTGSGSTETIKVIRLLEERWDGEPVLDAVYIASGAIYLEFSSSVAMTPILLGARGDNTVNLEWVLKTTYTYDSSTDRIEPIQDVRTTSNSGLSVLDGNFSNGADQVFTASGDVRAFTNSISFTAPRAGKYLVSVSNVPIEVTGTPVGVLDIQFVTDNSATINLYSTARAGTYSVAKTFVMEWSKGNHTIALRGISRDGEVSATAKMTNNYATITITAL